MKVQDGIEQLYFVTAFLRGKGFKDETNSPVEWTGTGFIYGVVTDQGQANFLVTNKHVFDGEQGVTPTSLDVRLIASDGDGQPAFGKATSVRLNRNPGDIQGHADDEVDVAIIPFQFINDAMDNSGANPFFRVIGGDVVLPPQDLSTQASALENIVFIGYPSGIYDSANLTPVARRGITATPIALDYEGKPAFLIDGAVFGGSSGSPVFIYGPAPPPKEGPISLGPPPDRLVFAGILASVHTLKEFQEVVELPTSLASVTTHHLGLGIVYKPQTIDECIDLRLKEAGLKRVAGEAEADESGSTADEELARDAASSSSG